MAETTDEDARLRREVEAHDRAVAQLPDDPLPAGATVEEMQTHTRRWWERVDELVRADLGYIPRKLTFRERMTDGSGLRLFKGDAAGVIAWVRSAQPTQPPEDVAAHVAHLVEIGRLTDADVAEVHRQLPDVARASG